MNIVNNQEYFQYSSLCPQKQILQNTLGCLKYVDQTSKHVGYGSCFLFNSRTVLVPFQYVFNRQTLSYSIQLEFFINSLYSYQVVQIIPLANRTKESIQGIKNADFAILKLDRNVEQLKTIFQLNDQHSNPLKIRNQLTYEQLRQELNQTMQAKDTITKQFNDMRQKLIEISQDLQISANRFLQDQDTHTATTQFYCFALHIQQYIFGEYSLNIIKLRKQMSDAYQTIQRDESIRYQQYLIILEIYQRQGMLNDEDYADTLYQLARISKQCGKTVEAIRFCQQALHIYTEISPYMQKSCAQQLNQLLNKRLRSERQKLRA